MELTEEQKKTVETQMVETIILALEKHEIRIHDLHPLAKMILEKIDDIRTQEDLKAFVEELNKKWPVFHQVTAE